MIYHPYLVRRTEGDGDRLESHWHRSDQRHGFRGWAGDGKNLETIGGGVGGEEQLGVGGENQGAHLSSLEQRVGCVCSGRCSWFCGVGYCAYRKDYGY